MHEAAKLVRQEELLNLLLMHLSLHECAERLSVSYATARKYASEQEFLNNLRHLSQSIYEEVITDLKTERKTMQQKLTEASDKALEKLEKLLESASEPVVQKAADSILDRNSETARNKRIEGDIHSRFSIDPLLLMHAAATSKEISEAMSPNTLCERDATNATKATKALPEPKEQEDR